MTREEAIRILASSCIPGSKQTEALETLIPELAESEDERIRKEIISALKFANDGGVYDKHIAYLEKQKEQKPEWSEEDENMRESAIALIRKWTNYSGENVGDSIKVISWLQWLPLLAHQH